MAGYSGTPLATKLGLNKAQVAALVHAPAEWQVGDVPDAVRWADAGPADVIIAFHRDPTDFVAELDALAERIRPSGSLWIAWPRKAGGHVSDMTENLIRDAALERGLVDVKVAALDDNWSGLKLVWRRENR